MLEDDVWIQYIPPEGKPPFKVTLPPGLFNSPETFVFELNRLLLNAEEGGMTQLRIHIKQNKATLKLYAKWAEARISEKLRDILRFSFDRVTEAEPVLNGEDEIQLDTDMKNVYVYCDIVAARPVRDVMVPLLRTVPILDRSSASVFKIYDKPHYVPLSRFSLDTVEVLLSTDSGKTIPFGLGSSIVWRYTLELAEGLISNNGQTRPS
jgi:hypothetical protein